MNVLFTVIKLLVVSDSISPLFINASLKSVFPTQLSLLKEESATSILDTKVFALRDTSLNTLGLVNLEFPKTSRFLAIETLSLKDKSLDFCSLRLYLPKQ